MKTKQMIRTSRYAAFFLMAGFALNAVAGTASYSIGPSLQTGAFQYSLASADLMGNGQQDLVVCDGSVWLNTSPGDGSVSFNELPGVLPLCTYLAVADVNGDGKPDIIESNSSAQVAVFLNTTQPGDTVPSFTAPVYFNGTGTTAQLTTADINGDGLPDLVVTDNGACNLDILINTTVPGSFNPTFSDVQAYPAGNCANWAAVADFNADGKPDVVVENGLDNTFSVFVNTTPTNATVASFLPQQVFPVGYFPNMVTTADINGDGSPDVVIANNGENAISVMLNTTPNGSLTVSFAAEEDFVTGNVPDSVVAVDVDGDGMPDLVAANAQDGTVSVIQNTTTPGAQTASFADQVAYPVAMDPENLIYGDFNGDGKQDIAVLNTMSMDSSQVGTVSILVNTSN
jgi:hypothetical protein